MSEAVGVRLINEGYVFLAAEPVEEDEPMIFTWDFIVYNAHYNGHPNRKPPPFLDLRHISIGLPDYEDLRLGFEFSPDWEG
jgi:hypothetical protein